MSNENQEPIQPSDPEKKLSEISVGTPKKENELKTAKTTKEKTIEQSKSGVIIEYSNQSLSLV